MQLSAGFFICLLSALIVERSVGLRQGFYIIVAPGTVRSNTSYHVSLSLSDFHQSAWFRISLKGQHLHKVHKTVEVQPGTTQLVSLPVPPKLSFGHANLVLTGFNGILAMHEARLSVESQNYQHYVQTDKPRYKPGELVQFRVICVDEMTRPAVSGDVLDVLIYDDDDNLVKKIGNITLRQGVFKGQFQLTEHTLVGTWKIRVQADGFQMKQKKFLVSRYVLPLFTVEVVTKSDVSVLDSEVKILVKANYANGDPVKGNLSVNFAVNHRFSQSLQQTFSREAQIDGDHVVSLNVGRDLRIVQRDINGRALKLCVLRVEAQVRDAISRQVVEQTVTIAVHSSPCKIKVSAPKYFDPEAPVDVEVSITDLQDYPVREVDRSPVKIWGKPFSQVAAELLATTFLNENGIGTATLNLTKSGFARYVISAEYGGFTSHGKTIEIMAETAISLNVLSPKTEVGEEIVVQVRSRSPIDHFVYEIVSRGNILQAERANVTEGSTTYLLRIPTTYAMIPRISLYVHRVQGRRLDSALEHIHIGGVFKNSIEIDVESKVRPGVSVSVNVTTDEGSYVGLMGIDRRLLVETEREEHFRSDQVLSRLRAYDARNLNEEVDPGSVAGLVTFSNTVDVLSRGDSGGPLIVHGVEREEVDWDIVAVPPRIRRIFSDGWLFDDFERTPKEGLHLHRTIPDVITSWAITGFSLSPTTGLSFTKSASSISVLKSFFISMDLPNFVTEGEILEIPVYVFNNNFVDALTSVTIESQSEHLVILESFTDEAQFSFNETFPMSIPAQGRMRFTFSVKPLKAGHFNLTLRAMFPEGSDALQKTLTVVSQGVPHLTSKTYLVHFLENSEQEGELLVNIPETAIRGSEKVEMSVVGDTFGPLMQSLWDLVQVPYGDGRKMTTHFISNLLVLKYLKTFNVNNPSLERKAMVFLERGYQDLLTLKHLDGSFSFFERSTKRTGDPEQTAIVMWGLQEAKKFIQVDRSLVTRGLNLYLKRMQKASGGFQSGSGLEDDVALTALALLAFMEDEGNVNVTSKGLEFLYNSLDDLESDASAAIAKYALVRGRHEKSTEILSQLSRKAVQREMEWDKLTTLQGALEATSASFLNILQSQEKPTETLLPLVRTLLSSSDSKKIPTHLLALDAMIGIARDLDFGVRDLSVHFEGDQGNTGEVSVNSSNVHVLQTIHLNSATRKVRLQSRGKGIAVITVRSRYNMPHQNQTSSIFQTNVTVSERRDSFMSLEVCVSTRTSKDFTTLEVNLPSGYTLLEQIENPLDFKFESDASSRWLRHQVTNHRSKPKGLKADSSEGSLHVILKDVDDGGACIQLDAWRAFRVLNAKDVAVTVNDAYDEGQGTTTFHKLDLVEEVT